MTAQPAPIADETFTSLCECNSFCFLKVTMPVADAIVAQRDGLIVIANACPHGPEPTEQLVERHETYSLYRPTDLALGAQATRQETP